MSDDQMPSPARLTVLGLSMELVLLIAALILSRWGVYDHTQDLASLLAQPWLPLLAWTGLGTTFLSAIAIISILLPWRPCRELREFVTRTLVPLFGRVNLAQAASISASAGIGEEMLFRWSLQGGLQTLWPGPAGTVSAVILSAALFGLAHAVTPAYAVVATLIGAVLGSLMIASGSVVPAILAHAIYDFGAIAIVRMAVRRSSAQQAGELSIPE
jgi:hypothetical protein